MIKPILYVVTKSLLMHFYVLFIHFLSHPPLSLSSTRLLFVAGSDGRSVSSGSGSRGASRTPSPFGMIPLSFCSPASSIPVQPSTAVSVVNAPIHAHASYGGSNTIQEGNNAKSILPNSLPGKHVGISETYSRKVFVGGLPPDIDQGRLSLVVVWLYVCMLAKCTLIGGVTIVAMSYSSDEIKDHFIRFGSLTVDWPHKAQSKAYFPPKGESL